MKRLTCKHGKNYDLNILNMQEKATDRIQNAINRLGYYEDMRDSGFLLFLPCKPDDTIYWILYDDIREKQYNNPLHISTETILDVSAMGITTESGFYKYTDLKTELGFFNKEKAERELERLRYEYIEYRKKFIDSIRECIKRKKKKSNILKL